MSPPHPFAAPSSMLSRGAATLAVGVVTTLGLATPAHADDVSINLGGYFLQNDAPFNVDISNAFPADHYTSWTLTTDWSRFLGPESIVEPGLAITEPYTAKAKDAKVTFSGPGITFSNGSTPANPGTGVGTLGPIDGLRWSSVFRPTLPALAIESYNPFTKQFTPREWGDDIGVKFDGVNQFLLTLNQDNASLGLNGDTTRWDNTVLTLSNDVIPGGTQYFAFEFEDAGDLGTITDDVSKTVFSVFKVYGTFTHLGGFLELDTLGSDVHNHLFLFDENGDLVAQDLAFSAGDGLSRITLADLPAGNYATIAVPGGSASTYNSPFGVHANAGTLRGNISLNLAVPEPASATAMLAAAAILLRRRRHA